MAKASHGLSFFPFSDVGKREQQEDYFYTGKPPTGNEPWLAIVADGMGGHESGNVASQEGVHAIRDAFLADASARRNIGRALSEATHKGHRAVVQAAEKRGALGNMGSTVVAFVIHGASLYWCSAGDSRLYLCRHGRLVQLTRDFTIAEDMRNSPRRGEWTTADIDASPRPDALTSFMGTDNWREHSGRTDLEAGDVIVACSDGVYGTLGNDGIAEACKHSGSRADAQSIAERLQQRVAEARDPKQDNATAIVVRYEASCSGRIAIGNMLGWGASALAILTAGVIFVPKLNRDDDPVKLGEPQATRTVTTKSQVASAPKPDAQPANGSPSAAASPAASPIAAPAQEAPSRLSVMDQQLESSAREALTRYTIGIESPAAEQIIETLGKLIDSVDASSLAKKDSVSVELTKLRDAWRARMLNWQVGGIEKRIKDGKIPNKQQALAVLRRIANETADDYRGEAKLDVQKAKKWARDLLPKIKKMRDLSEQIDSQGSASGNVRPNQQTISADPRSVSLASSAVNSSASAPQSLDRPASAVSVVPGTSSVQSGPLP